MNLKDHHIDISAYQHIVVAPLDWGLGHATRCIPLIQFFLSEDKKVSLAGYGSSLELLKMEFPYLSYYNLPGYGITYPASRFGFGIKMALQSPKIFTAIRREFLALNQIIKKTGADMVLSDNRYGCYSKTIHSVFMGHQITIQLPKSLDWINGLNQKFIKNFNECWVPDYPSDSDNLSGKLSHGGNKISVRYIGPLSRFKKNDGPSNSKFKYLAILSGPEPQKSMLEAIIRTKFSYVDEATAIVLGNPNNFESHQENKITFFSHLKARELNQLIHESDEVICRSGYSSVMDMRALNKGAILVPTPGQSEQEYLAEYLNGRYGFRKVEQRELEQFEFLN